MLLISITRFAACFVLFVAQMFLFCGAVLLPLMLAVCLFATAQSWQQYATAAVTAAVGYGSFIYLMIRADRER